MFRNLEPLPLARLPELRPLPGVAQALEAAFALEAAIAGNLTCHAWVDDLAQPSVAYLWDGAYLHYVLGAHSAAAQQAVTALLVEALAPQAQARGVGAIKLHTAHASWEPWLPPLPQAQRYERVAYLLEPAQTPSAPAMLAAAYRLVALTPALLADATLDTTAARAEIASCWPSVAQFAERGWGYGALCGPELVAWCTAELVSPGRCGVGIETVAAHQRRGLGAAIASAMAQHCVRTGVSALWDAWAANLPSRRTSERAGWSLAETYTVAFAPLAEA